MSKNSVTKVKQGSIFEEKVKDVLEILGYRVKVNELVIYQIDLIAQKSDGLIDICLCY